MNKTILVAVLAASGLLAESPSFATYQGALAESNDSYKTESDRQIVVSIRNKIDDGSGRYDHVNISVQGGVVTLRGFASSEVDIRNLVSAINTISNVISINNYLILKPQAPAEPPAQNAPHWLNPPKDTFLTGADRQILMSIRSYMGNTHTYDHVSLSVMNAQVILQGWVENSADVDTLIRYVTNIPGVSSIKTNITVRN